VLCYLCVTPVTDFEGAESFTVAKPQYNCRLEITMPVATDVSFLKGITETMELLQNRAEHEEL
jgi:hypothetical protein